MKGRPAFHLFNRNFSTPRPFQEHIITHPAANEYFQETAYVTSRDVELTFTHPKITNFEKLIEQMRDKSFIVQAMLAITHEHLIPCTSYALDQFREVMNTDQLVIKKNVNDQTPNHFKAAEDVTGINLDKLHKKVNQLYFKRQELINSKLLSFKPSSYSEVMLQQHVEDEKERSCKMRQ